MSETRGLLSKAVVLGAAVVLGVAIIVMSVAGNVATAGKPQPPPPPHFVDNGDGTITDNQTGLMWETKTSGGGGPRDVNNTYTWSSTGTNPDGTLFTDFLPKMNCEISADGSCPFDGKYSDWRIPTIAELRTIVAACGGGGACIDPIFGPTAAPILDGYWSSSSNAGSLPLPNAWLVDFHNSLPSADAKTDGHFARAVRGGS